MKLISAFQRVISYLPLLWFISFVSFVLRAIIVLEKMPKYNLPDPKDLGFDFHQGILFFSLPIIFFSFLPWLLITLLIYAKDKSKLNKIDIWIFVLTYILFIFFQRIDPWGLGTWFID